MAYTVYKMIDKQILKKYATQSTLGTEVTSHSICGRGFSSCQVSYAMAGQHDEWTGSQRELNQNFEQERLCWLLHFLISFNPRQLSRAIG